MTGSSASPWDREASARAWLRFSRGFDRYRVVNAALAANASLAGVRSVLDVGAGTGGTTAALLPYLGEDARVTCFEPAGAMRRAAELRDDRLGWTEALPDRRFERVICGAALWLLGSIDQALSKLAERIEPGGALVFAIPAAYLGEPDPPGGGPDPWLGELPSRLVEGRRRAPDPGPPFPNRAQLERHLGATGLRAEPWAVETRWTLESYAAWLSLPPVGGAMRPDLSDPELADAVASALEACAPGSWRPERWAGWTAWT